VTGNETPNRPSVAGTASEIERNDTQDRHQERFAVAFGHPRRVPAENHIRRYSWEGRQAGLHGLPVVFHLWRRLVEVLAYRLVMCAFTWLPSPRRNLPRVETRGKDIAVQP
jgi:hypothetical protein